MEISSFFTLAFVLSILRGATPLIFSSFGGFFSERSGLVQIGLEGMMLIGALAGAIVGFQTQSAWLGFVCAGLAGLGIALLFGILTVTFKANQILAGTALNLFAAGIAPLITKALFSTTGQTPSLPLDVRFRFEPILVIFIVILLVQIFWSKSSWGVWLRFLGEQPEVLTSNGFSKLKLQFNYLLVGGFLAGLGGGTLSLFLSSNYSPNMTAGRGFIALAALVFGKWKPIPTVMACLFFALVDAIQIRLQGQVTSIPIQFIQILPYLVTIIALAGFFGQSRPPNALGRNS